MMNHANHVNAPMTISTLIHVPKPFRACTAVRRFVFAQTSRNGTMRQPARPSASVTYLTEGEVCA